MAPNVHDFTWAADPNYIHDIHPGPNGVIFIFSTNDEAIINNWKKLQPHTAELMRFYNKNIGPTHTNNTVWFKEGRGMEYAMLTLITGGRDYRSLFGVTAHELAHSWFQHILATNEMKHEWMDEGFTSYICTLAEDLIMEENKPFPWKIHMPGIFTWRRVGLKCPNQPMPIDIITTWLMNQLLMIKELFF